MISKETFCKVIGLMQEQDQVNDQVEKALELVADRVFFFGAHDRNSKAVRILLKEIFHDKYDYEIASGNLFLRFAEGTNHKPRKGIKYMSYTKARIPTEVYHLTKKENLDSILADKRIRRFGDTECWFCRDIPDMLRYMEYTVLNEGAPYIGVGGRMMYYPKFEPGEHVLLKLTPQKWEDKWYQWNQVVPQNASAETKAQAAEFSTLKVGYRGDLRFSKCEVIELEPLLAEHLAQEGIAPVMVL